MLGEKYWERKKENNKDRYGLGETVIPTDSKNYCPQLLFLYFIYKKKYSIFEVQHQRQNEKNKLNKNLCCNTEGGKTFSLFCAYFKLSSNAQYLLNLLHNLNSRYSKWFRKSFARERERGREIKENLFQQLIKIQRQWCYRAPIKKLSVHWQWHLF